MFTNFQLEILNFDQVKAKCSLSSFVAVFLVFPKLLEFISNPKFWYTDRKYILEKGHVTNLNYDTNNDGFGNKLGVVLLIMCKFEFGVPPKSKIRIRDSANHTNDLIIDLPNQAISDKMVTSAF